ncbi:hypothetical protein KL933_002283 [Ogataea haglerorum]|uniref:SWI5-dependent HO expression protein 3 n=1 Tax=Ogataea haglerorum TaxID=1937702 RepID=A0AAN6D6C7_9ASCO|nr:hypothetical protein KL914_004970 [Ogataea haglerorum]KAG7728157.1 hypothetical protein KL933_002283 [Ogataea haglerorum]KAG7731546.1 hypothetical protein KL948_003176 [Ogataea haglerorum]KAG7765358.1 hypothetical protein KL946_002415 [Ogataea haglerorum]KAG7789020.1 hypothetical protein KL910_002718 [Ogataea haglerorum]
MELRWGIRDRLLRNAGFGTLAVGGKVHRMWVFDDLCCLETGLIAEKLNGGIQNGTGVVVRNPVGRACLPGAAREGLNVAFEYGRGGTSKVIESLHMQIDGLKGQLDDTQAELDEFKRKLSVVVKHNETLAEKLSSARHQNEVSESLLSRKERKVLDLEAQLAEACSAADRWKFEEDSLRRKLAAMQEQESMSTVEAERLRASYDVIVESQKEYKLRTQMEVGDLRRQLKRFIQESSTRLEKNRESMGGATVFLEESYKAARTRSEHLAAAYERKQAHIQEALNMLEASVTIQEQNTKATLAECQEALQQLKRTRSRYAVLTESNSEKENREPPT